jgi:microsomal dipeptidase-like Zn-dependent dipeptidase
VRRLLPGALAATVLAALAPPAAAAELANRCVGFQSSATGRVAGPFHLKPTAIGRYLLHDRRGRLLSATRSGGAIRARTAGRLAEWAIRPLRSDAVVVRSVATGRRLGGARARFRVVARRGCRRFPEARVGATRARGAPPLAGLRGFADLHVHITADMRAGGRVISGRAFHRFGIPAALGGDARTHGADGSLDVTGNLLRTGLPFGGHDTHGWPSFRGWPEHDTNTHQQVYWRWLERAWRAGLRLVVAQTVEDEPICRIVPRREYPCDETSAIARQVRRLRALEDYVDAQSGGRGRGWFRLVYGPAQARRAIRRGRLAVVIGVESSNPFGCSVRLGAPRCSRADIDRGIEHLHRLGVRSLFMAHWVDNALAGAALEGGVRGVFINVFNRFQTGRYFTTSRCPRRGQGEEMRTLSAGEMQVLAGFYPAVAPLVPEGMPSYPRGRRCNPRGLTSLGRYALRRLMDRHMMIEADHLSERARSTALALAVRRGYPLVSSHTDTGGVWTEAQLRRLYASGGIASARLDGARGLARNLVRLDRIARAARRRGGVPVGTDVGGFASLPGPRHDAARRPLRYPFTLSGFRFARERSGRRVFDLNRDGVAHYGLIADLVADMRQQSDRSALRALFASARAYLRSWRRAAAG